MTAYKYGPTVTIAGLTTAATPYNTGDQMGTVGTFTSIVDRAGAGVNIVGWIVTDDSGVLGAFDLVLFNGTAAPTLAADNAAAVITAADNQKVQTVCSFLAANCVNTGGRVTATFYNPPGIQPVKVTAAKQDLYVGLIARTANAVFAAGATSIQITPIIAVSDTVS